MAKILFIDDEPIRAMGLIRRGHDVFLACGFEQINAYLGERFRPGDGFDLVCLDHDMPSYDGMQVTLEFLIERGYPVVVHSANETGARDMITLLEEYHVPCVRIGITVPNFSGHVTEYADNL